MSLSTQRLPSSSSSSSTSPSTYDVFLSFCGEDTRHGFTDHLYAALKQRGLFTFRDDEKLQRGNDISQELLTAIRESQYAVVVLSKNFASSSWCLRELTQIIECMREGRLKVLPVFYHVDPSDVRKQKGIFAEAFDKHRENFKINGRQTKSHRTEMKEVADSTVDPSDVRRQKSSEEASSKHRDNPEINRRQMKSRRTDLTEVVDCAVDPSVARNQDMHFAKASASNADNPDSDGDPVKSWRDALKEVGNLCGWHVNDSSEATVVQKIATKIFCGLRLNSSKMFKNLVGVDTKVEELVSLLCLENDDVRYIGIHGMGGVGKTTLAKVLYHTICCEFQASCFISGTENNQSRSVKELQQEIIRKILKEHNVEVWNDYDGAEFLEMRLCNKKVLIVFDDINQEQLEALAGNPDLFCQKSRIVITSRNRQFWKPLVSDDGIYEVKPLEQKDALQLFCWKVFNKPKPREDFVELSKIITRYVGGLPLAIKVLGSSLVGKEMVVWNSICYNLKTNPDAQILDKLQLSYDCLDDFQRRVFLDIACLFNGMDVAHINPIWQSQGFSPKYHTDALRDKSLLEFSWNGQFHMHDLIQKMGQRIVSRENLEPGKRSRLYCHDDIVHVLKNKSGTNAVKGIIFKFSSKKQKLSFEGFSNFKSLEILIIEPKNGYWHLEKGIVWSGCYSKLRLSNQLRLLKWRACPLPFFPRSFQLNNLVRLEMSFSRLKQLWHERMYFKNLTYFSIESEDLIEIPDFSGAPRLEEITFLGCISLLKVHPSIGNLSQLQHLSLKGCMSLEELPKEFNLESLLSLDLSCCLRLKKLPDLSRVPHIKDISIPYCKSLRELPPSIENLEWLQSLKLSFCESLEKFPEKISCKSLNKLDLFGCSRLKKLPDLSSSPNISKIILTICESLRELHPSIGNLKRLQSLTFYCCTGLEELPEEINWEALEELDLRYCLSLKKLPNLSGIPDIKRINLSNCESLKKLHPSIGNLQQLQYLSLSSCINLKKISKKIKCKSLKELYLNECLRLKEFPKIGGDMTALRKVDLRGTAIKWLRSSFQKLSSLEELLLGGSKRTKAIQPPHDILRGCTGFRSGNYSFRVPNWLANFKLLRKLHLQYCNLSDESFLRDFSITSVTKLNLSGNRFTKIPEFFNRFPKVERVGFDPHPLKALPRPWLNLNLSDCSLLGGAIWNDSLSAVYSLHLDESEFTRLTDNFCLLYNLKKLYLRKCRWLLALPKLPSKLKELNVTGSPLLEMIYDQRDMETSWEASRAHVCLWFSAASINGHDGTPYKIIELQPPCLINNIISYWFLPKVSSWYSVSSAVSWGPTMRFEIPEWFQQRSTGEFQGRLNMDENWLGYALFVVYEVHEHGFPEFVCQFHLDDNAQEQPLVLRVPEARSVGENGFWAFVPRDTLANAFRQRRRDVEPKDYGFSIISNSLKAEIKECGARVVCRSEESEFFHVLRSISQQGLELKEFKEFWFWLKVGWHSDE